MKNRMIHIGDLLFCREPARVSGAEQSSYLLSFQRCGSLPGWSDARRNGGSVVKGEAISAAVLMS
jgi:hypothetical protein